MDVFVYAYRHFRYYVEHYTGSKALESAVLDAHGAADAGSESLSHIEVWENGEKVRTISSGEVWEEAERFAPLTVYEPSPPPTAVLEVNDGDERWAHFRTYLHRDDATDDEARLIRAVGHANRVRVRPLTAAPR